MPFPGVLSARERSDARLKMIGREDAVNILIPKLESQCQSHYGLLKLSAVLTQP
jgi:hypothetical protein